MVGAISNHDDKIATDLDSKTTTKNRMATGELFLPLVGTCPYLAFNVNFLPCLGIVSPKLSCELLTDKTNLVIK